MYLIFKQSHESNINLLKLLLLDNRIQTSPLMPRAFLHNPQEMKFKIHFISIYKQLSQ